MPVTCQPPPVLETPRFPDDATNQPSKIITWPVLRG